MNKKEKEMEDALIAEAVAKGRVTKCPDGMAAEALQFGAHFMRDRFGDMAPGLIEERTDNSALANNLTHARSGYRIRGNNKNRVFYRARQI